MALFFKIDVGLPVYEVGIIFTLLSVFSILFSILGGAFADFFGRKPTLLLGSLSGFAIYLSIFALIRFYFHPLLIITLFIVSSLSGSLVFPSSSALVADVTTEKERVNAYVVYRILTNAGWAIGPAIGGIIYGLGVSYIFMAVTVASIVQFFIVLLSIDEAKSFRKPVGSSVGKFQIISFDKYLIAFSIGTFFVTLVSSQFSVTLPLYSGIKIGIAVSAISYIYAINGLVVVLGQYPITILMKRFPDMASMILGSIFYSIGYFMVGISPDLLWLILDMVIITIGENLTSPMINTVVSKIAPKPKVARYMGFTSMINSTGRAMGPSVGSLLLFVFAYNGLRVWSFIDIFGAISVIAFLMFGKMMRIRHTPNPSPTTQES